MTEPFDDIVAAATAATALEAGAIAAGSGRFVEKDLQKLFALALESELGKTKGDLLVKTELSVDFTQWQPKVGTVDVALVEGVARHPFAMFELKCGSRTLYNCIWDVAKMAVAVAGGYTTHAYLVAAAPTIDWTAAAAGSEFFDSRTFRVRDLFMLYPTYWGFWKRDVKTHPRMLPEYLDTAVVASAPFRVKGADWEVRVAAVAAQNRNWWSVEVLEAELGIALSTDTAEVEGSEDLARFEEGDVAALWKLVRDPPRWWRFSWFPGDVEFVGKTFEESWGAEQAALLRLTRAIRTTDDLASAHEAIEAFVRNHPGDSTAISAGRDYVLAERALGISRD